MKSFDFSDLEATSSVPSKKKKRSDRCHEMRRVCTHANAGQIAKELRKVVAASKRKNWKRGAYSSVPRDLGKASDSELRLHTGPDEDPPWLFKWTNYDSTGGGVTFGLPACLLYFPAVFRRICSKFREKMH